MKVDLHCHSKYSKRPSIWIMKKLGCPESFTEPTELYRLARKQGMDAVTITDHNVIGGCLDIAHLENTFISCEYTTYFPADGAKIHMLAYDITESQHRECDRLRENVFDLVEYCRQEGIFHACAHPLWGPGGQLEQHHVEMLLLLFKIWELNGDIHPAMNVAVEKLVQSLTPELIERLAGKHGIVPPFERPWEKAYLAGSDDHSSLNLTRSYTEVASARTLNEFFDGIAEQQAKIRASRTNPQAFARTIYGIAYQFYRQKLRLGRFAGSDMFLQFLDNALRARPERSEPRPSKLGLFIARKFRSREGENPGHPLFDIARAEAEKIIAADPQLLSIVREGARHGADMDEKWFEFVDKLSNKALLQFGAKLVERFAQGHFFDLFNSLGSAGAIYGFIAPFFIAYAHHRELENFGRRAVQWFDAEGAEDQWRERPARVAHFTDTFNEVNGVARTLHEQLDSARRLGKEYTIVTCFGEDRIYKSGVRHFTPVGSVEMPGYPEIKLLCPPLLGMLQHCYEAGYTHIHVSTPGPVGLAGMAIARILQLPLTGTYHTAFPQYVRTFTDDSYVEDVTWKCMLWFYSQMDAVYVPSEATGEELVERGIRPEKVRAYPRGVDSERFHPDKRTGILSERYGVGAGELTFLYVGRISKEKNLHLLCQAYKDLIERGYEKARLVLVGDGPYREEMEAALAGTPAVFTGYIAGGELSALYASCDVFVFPSATDTFGNVVLEAQASGLPVIVTDVGGPHENCIEGETGLVVPAGCAASLREAMERLHLEPERREAMGRAAREFMEGRGFDEAFSVLWDMYLEQEKRPAAHAKINKMTEITELARVLVS